MYRSHILRVSVLQCNIPALLQFLVRYVVKHRHFNNLVVTDISRRATDRSRDSDWLLSLLILWSSRRDMAAYSWWMAPCFLTMLQQLQWLCRCYASVVEYDVHVTVHRDKFLQQNPTRCTNFSNFVFGIRLYMFRAVPLSIIRSFSLCAITNLYDI